MQSRSLTLAVELFTVDMLFGEFSCSVLRKAGGPTLNVKSTKMFYIEVSDRDQTIKFAIASSKHSCYHHTKALNNLMK